MGVVARAGLCALAIISALLCAEKSHGRGGFHSPHALYPHVLGKGEVSTPLYQIRVNGKSGYMNRSGEVVIEPVFAGAALFFREGLAWVTRDPRRAYTENGKKSSVSARRKYGFIDTTGRVVIPPQFDTGGRFIEGLAAVKMGGKYGYVDVTGKTVIEPRFTSASWFRDGVAVVRVEKKAGILGEWQLIDKKGQVLAELPYDYVDPFRDRLARVKAGDGFGYIDKTGRLVIKPGSWGHSALPFCEGLALVQVEGWYGFIDETGAFAIRPQYWRAGGFSEGLAPVRNREKWGFIDKTGRMVIEPQFDWVRMGFWEGMAQVHDNREWWFIDRTGKKTIKLPSAAIRVFRGGLAWAAVGRKRGYIDKTGKWVWEPSE